MQIKRQNYLNNFFTCILTCLVAVLFFNQIAYSQIEGIKNKNEDQKRSISFSWPKVKGSIGYQIEFIRKSNGDYKIKTPIIRVNEPSWSGLLLPGRYQFRLQTLDSRSVPGQWSDPSDLTVRHKPVQVLGPEVDEKFPSKSDDMQEISVNWKHSLNTAFYKVKVYDEKGKKIISEIESKTTNAKINLPVAKKYTLKIIAISHDDDDGDEEKIGQPFLIMGKRISKPKIEIEKNDIENIAEWSKPEFSNHFYIEVLFKAFKKKKGKKEKGKKKREKRKWKKIFEQDFYKKNTYKLVKKGKYKLRITAKGPLRQPSRKLIYRFNYPVKKKKSKEISSSDLLNNKSGSFTYAFIPALQVFSLISETVNTNLSIILVNSHKLSTKYWFNKKSFGLNLGLQRQSMTLFESNSDDVSSAQKPISLLYWNYDISAIYRLHLGNLKLDFEGGYASKTLYIFKQESIESLEATESRINEILVGGSVHYNWNTNDLGISIRSLFSISASPQLIESSEHTGYSLYYESTNKKSTFRNGYSLDSNFAKYLLKDDANSETQEISTTNISFRFSFSWLY